jgi:hypothetical protein
MTMTTKTKKRRLTQADINREIDAEKASLRRRLSRLLRAETKPGGVTHDYKPRVTFRMFCILMRIDDAMVGTPDYMGLAYWWSHEYKHDLRAATPKERKRAHDAILDAGLELAGESEEHEQIIAWATNNGRQASKDMGVNWRPYRGPRPAKRKAKK